MGHTIAVVVGSLRKQSFNRKLAEAIANLPAARGHEFVFVEIGDLPLYDQDDDDDQPAPVRRMKGEIEAADGVLFVTPEYNRSVPGVLKNAIDHGSRPYGKSCWKGKPAAIAGASPGAMGTALAQQHLRNILSVLGMPALTLPEVFLVWKEGLVTDEGKIGEQSAEFLDIWVEAFVDHISRHKS